MSHSYTLQLHTGSFTKATYSITEIKEKCDHILAGLTVKDVILGWNTDQTLNKALVTYFHDLGMRVLLWLPVLAETEELADIVKMKPFGKTEGNAVKATSNERFSFACPCDLSNVHEVIRIYEEHFASIPFDGIFLDKIRFASFANGYEEGFGCFCNDCEKQMLSVDLPYIKQLIDQHDPKLMRGEYDDFGRYHFADYQVNTFYKRRSQMITDLVFKLAAYFNSRKLIVGVDVYAPIMAYHVGQNIKEIGKLVDFVKPMMYTHTNAPAGIQYEYNAYIKHFDQPEPFTKHFPEGPLSNASLRRQLDYLTKLPAHVIPGIEINSIEGICTTSAEEVAKQCKIYAQYSTLALSWDIMQMSEEIKEVLQSAQ